MLHRHFADGPVVRGYEGIPLDGVSLDYGRDAGVLDLTGRSCVFNVCNDAVCPPILELRQGAIPAPGLTVKGPGAVKVRVLGDTELELSTVFSGGFQQ